MKSGLVVFVHAVGGDASFWAPQVAAVQKCLPHLDTLAVDLSLPADAVSMSGYAQQLADMVLDRGYQRAHFVGLSMGAVVAMQLLDEAPGMARSLTLANTWMHQPEAAGKLAWFDAMFASHGLAGFSAATMPPLFAPQTDPAVVARAVAVESGKDPEMYRASWHAMLPHDARAVMRDCDVPVLLIGGALDTVTPTSLLDAIAAVVPTALRVELPKAAHFSNLDDVEGFNRAMIGFLRANHGSVDDRLIAAPAADLAMPGERAATRLLRVLAARGVEAIYSNSGTDFTPIIEGLAVLKREGVTLPTVVAAPHENTVIAMAHGHALITGRAQVAMAHVNVGTANMGLGLINARRARVPMVAMAGRTPWFEADIAGLRSNFVQWGQETRDQGAMFREFTKWDYELRHPNGLETVLDRAFALSESAPQGPVYLTLPKEPLCMPSPAAEVSAEPRMTPTRPTRPDDHSLFRAQVMIDRAKRPVIVTADLGRHKGGAEALVRFAERWGIAVVEHGKRNFFNFPTEHRLHAGFEPLPLVAEADLVIAIECPVPWIPAFAKLPRAPQVLGIGVDPLFEDLPLRGFPVDFALVGDPVETLSRLDALDATKDPGDVHGGFAARRDAARAEGASGRLSKSYLSLAVGEVLDDTVLVFNEYPLDPWLVPRRVSGSWFENSVASGLGWALGAALGAAVALPERTMLAAVGDGSYLFNTPLSAHAVAVWNKLPVVVLVFNDAAWTTIKKSTRGSHPDGVANRENDFALCDFPSALDLAAVAEGCGMKGLRITRPDEAHAVLAEALRLAREGGHAVLVDARVERDA
ncbi:MAG: thiamine pyrophosphate-requiring protein [Myxococcales bacterium]|nr:thiamine pyrophosphate-requiring protein [Myxococcales bacterium]